MSLSVTILAIFSALLDLSNEVIPIHKNIKLDPSSKIILKQLPWTLKHDFMKIYLISKKSGIVDHKGDERSWRRVGIERLVGDNLQETAGSSHYMNSLHRDEDFGRRSSGNLSHRRQMSRKELDMAQMKVKLFTQMYWTVQDTEIRVQRLGLIKHYYQRRPQFAAGFMVSDIESRMQAMRTMNFSMRRLMHDWSAEEMVNAFETVYNYGIDITTLTDTLLNFDLYLFDPIIPEHLEAPKKKGRRMDLK